MRAPKRKRKMARAIAEPPAGTDLKSVAQQARYTGSPDHKDTSSFAGKPRPRVDATLCDPSLVRNQGQLPRWLRRAIRGGCTGSEWQGGFPKYVWYSRGGTVYEGCLINRGLGEYKGYPLREDERPAGIERCHG